MKRRCGPAWQPHLAALVRAYYFKARRNGNCPKFNRLGEEEMRRRVRTRQRADAVRNVRYREACEASAEFEAVLDEFYSGSLFFRATKAEQTNTMRINRGTLHEANRQNALVTDIDRCTVHMQACMLTLRSQQDREGRLEVEELQQHLWESCGRPADGERFFPLLYPPLK